MSADLDLGDRIKTSVGHLGKNKDINLDQSKQPAT